MRGSAVAGRRRCYQVVGQTHPKVLARDGEAYRRSLTAGRPRAGVANRVSFDARYLDVAALKPGRRRRRTSWCFRTTPREQVTSGVLIEAVAAGKPSSPPLSRTPRAARRRCRPRGAARRPGCDRRGAAPGADRTGSRGVDGRAVQRGRAEPALVGGRRPLPANSRRASSPPTRSLVRVTESGAAVRPSAADERRRRASSSTRTAPCPRVEDGYCLDDVARALVVVCRQPARHTGAGAPGRAYFGFVTTRPGPGRHLPQPARSLRQAGRTSPHRRLVGPGPVGVSARPPPAAPDRRSERPRLTRFERSAGAAQPGPAFDGVRRARAAECSPLTRTTARRGTCCDATADVIGRPGFDADWPWPMPRLDVRQRGHRRGADRGRLRAGDDASSPTACACCDGCSTSRRSTATSR